MVRPADIRSSGPRAKSRPRRASSYLAQLLLVQFLRAHLATDSSRVTGWLRAASDPKLAAALRLINSDPGHNWSLEELASACIPLAECTRFQAAVGHAPKLHEALANVIFT